MVVKKKRTILAGNVNVTATFNNTIVTISDPQGDVIVWSSAGANGFKGSKKSTPYAAQMAAEKAATKAMGMGLRSVCVKLQGAGAGREAAIRGLVNAGLNVMSIANVMIVAHNGCRAPKRRRV